MTLSSCLIVTDERHHVTIPNAKIWGNAIRNLSRGKPARSVQGAAESSRNR